MKRMIIAMLLIAGVASAATVERQGDGKLLTRDVPIQGFSPNGLYSNATATNATFHDLRNFLAYSSYCAANCYMRLTPTAAKGTYPQTIIIGGDWTTPMVKNAATPFVNISSASGATHQWLQQ